LHASQHVCGCIATGAAPSRAAAQPFSAAGASKLLPSCC
jgi:hypothetical protein